LLKIEKEKEKERQENKERLEKNLNRLIEEDNLEKSDIEDKVDIGEEYNKCEGECEFQEFDPDNIEIAQIVNQEYPWRSKGGSQNYYYKRSCEECGGKVSCQTSCQLNKRFGGRT